nr:PREDICTED: guanine nucleotide-binding protein G(I)/G(S)/G(O) subunit gamma-2 [Opisthocomus hoazin]
MRRPPKLVLATVESGEGCGWAKDEASADRGASSPEGEKPAPPIGSLARVSKAAADLMVYCEAHAKEDPLLTPVPASENPFREKKFFCVIL